MLFLALIGFTLNRNMMKFRKFEAYTGNRLFRIEEDFPEVGAYLYIFEEKVCVNDFLQNSVKECQDFALEEFDVPLDRWVERVQ